VKVAVTALEPFIVSTQVVAVPAQAPDHPANVDPRVARAVSVTAAPFA
jgi:hypothetical protein